MGTRYQLLHSEKSNFTRRALALAASATLAFTVMGVLISFPNSEANAYTALEEARENQDTQSVQISASVRTPELKRDSYSVVSAAEVKRTGLLATSESLNSFLQATEQSFVIHDKNDGTVIYPVTTWHFNYEDNGYHTSQRPTHNGVDMPIGEGTDIYAVADATVIEVGYGADGYGNYAILRHSIGGYTVETLYAHMVRPPNVAPDQTVKKGEVIGHVGTTGRSTGNHLHFEVTVNGARQDPASWLELNAIR